MSSLPRDAVAERFQEKVMPEPNTGCHLWFGAAGTYGTVTVAKRAVSAHRLAWMLYRGPIPLGMSVLHSCDTPLCVNPDHLFLGFSSDNMVDMSRKRRGSKHNTNKISCLRGHLYEEVGVYHTTYTGADGSVRTSRGCKQCNKDRGVARRAHAVRS